MRCTSCGFENPAGGKFCSECGAQLNAPIATPVSETAGERRHLTVLFSDLVGSTEISSRLDPEEFRELVADYHRATADAITRFGGYVAKYLGDGVMAYFGWPQAHDNDAERAARAGLAIVDAVGALNQRDGQGDSPKMSVRVGIDSGHVVIGKGGGSDSEVFGDAANIAARVQSAAEPDAVIVTPAVNRLVAGLFVVEASGAHQLKGIAEPIELYRIVRLSSVRNRLAASMVHGLTPFVGRHDETQLLWSCWERASGGEGQVLLISGEAGIGKSRLVRQFRKRLAPTPHLWIECAGSPYYQNTPFYPIADMLQQNFAQSGDGSDAAKRRALERALEIAELELEEAVPLIAAMMNLDVSEKYPPLALSPEQQRKRLMTTLARWLFAAVQSVVMAVEDLHWFDASSLELMQLLAEQAATDRVMLVCTARPEFRAPWTPRAHHTHFTLNRLAARDVRELVVQVVATNALSGEAIDKVIERTGGVPLFVEELTRAVLERGDAKPDPREIPATLHDSLMARLDRLGPAKEVAQVASVIGREFSHELLGAVSTIPESDLHSALAKLSESDLIHSRGIPPEATYSFKHALIRDTAYEALLKSRRRELHRRVSVAMTETFPALAETQLEVVARHWTDAGETTNAIAAWRKAGDAGSRRSAFTEAENAYRHTLDLIRTQAESRERDAQELELMNRLVPVLQLAKGWAAPEATEAIAYAHSLAEKTDNLAQLLLQVVGAFVSNLSRGDLSAATALATQISDLAVREGSREVLGLASVGEITTRYFRGDLSGAEDHFLAGANSFQVAGARFATTVASGFGFGSHVAWMLGRADTARDRIRQAISGATDLKSPFELAYAQYLAAMLHLFVREFADAKTFAEKSIALSDEYGIRQYSAGSRVFLGLAEAASGHPAKGIPIINLGMEGLHESGGLVAMTLYLSWVAVAQSLEGKVPEALATIEKALLVNPEELAWRPDAIRIRGELRRTLGNIDAAEADFRDAIALARKIGAKAWELRAAMSLVRILRKRGGLAEARDLLGPLYASFSEGFDTADLVESKALLDELNQQLYLLNE
ncbi:MAG TPA: adenylate/guanylate cyclase domain-containing protein [Sporolactobacillaceae bacterium]|nr:adenylate/guanylate cyclase domain-containing protein [Sporolactobacillaceae bacterium]